MLLFLHASWFLLVVFLLLGSILRAGERPGHLHSLDITNHIPRPCATRPCRSQSAAQSLPVPIRVVYLVPGLLSPSVVLPLHMLLFLPASWFLLVVFLLLGSLLRSGERPGHLHSLDITNHIPRPCATRPCRSCQAAWIPPPCPIDPIPVSLGGLQR